jgi:hypothetical protein
MAVERRQAEVAGDVLMATEARITQRDARGLPLPRVCPYREVDQPVHRVGVPVGRGRSSVVVEADPLETLVEVRHVDPNGLRLVEVEPVVDAEVEVGLGCIRREEHRAPSGQPGFHHRDMEAFVIPRARGERQAAADVRGAEDRAD